MANVGVLVVVGEVGVERVGVELDLRAGVGGGLPGFLGGDRCARRPSPGGLAGGFGPCLGGSCGGGRNGPVVAVAADGADDLFFGNDLEDVAEVVDEPVLAAIGPGG